MIKAQTISRLEYFNLYYTGNNEKKLFQNTDAVILVHDDDDEYLEVFAKEPVYEESIQQNQHQDNAKRKLGSIKQIFREKYKKTSPNIMDKIYENKKMKQLTNHEKTSILGNYKELYESLTMITTILMTSVVDMKKRKDGNVNYYRLDAPEFIYRFGNQRCSKCWISHIPNKKWCSRQKLKEEVKKENNETFKSHEKMKENLKKKQVIKQQVKGKNL